MPSPATPQPSPASSLLPVIDKALPTLPAVPSSGSTAIAQVSMRPALQPPQQQQQQQPQQQPLHRPQLYMQQHMQQQHMQQQQSQSQSQSHTQPPVQRPHTNAHPAPHGQTQTAMPLRRESADKEAKAAAQAAALAYQQQLLLQQQYEELDQEDSEDWVVSKLISQGWDTAAVRQAVYDAANTIPSDADQEHSLLQTAMYLVFLSTFEDQEQPRSVQFQLPNAPQQYQPLHRRIRPRKGIMRPPSVFPDVGRSKMHMAKEWLGKAAESLGFNPSSKRPGAGISSMFSKSLSPSNPFVDRNSPSASTSNNNNNSPNGAVPPLQPSSAGQPGPDQQPSQAPLKPKNRVRFMFPDMTIAPDYTPPETAGSSAALELDLVTPLPVAHAIDGLGDHGSAAVAGTGDRSTEANTPSATSTSDWAERVDVDRQSDLYSRRRSSQIVVRKSFEFKPPELHQYYLQLLQHDDREAIPALVDLLRVSVESNEFPDTIDLTGISLTVSSVKAFVELLTIDFGLKSLILDNCSLTDEILKMILQSVLPTATLYNVSIANNPRIQAHGIKYMAVFIKKSPSLRHLDISGITIDSKSAAYLNHALSAHGEKGFRQSTLETLKMDRTRLRSSHLEAMISGIRNSRLTELSLRNNQLSSSSGKHIAHILEPESDHTPAASAESLLFMPGSAEPTTRVAQLSILDLRDNRLSDGVVDIAQALAVNRRLKELSLRANQVDESGLLALVNALANNRALKSLDVSSNDVFSPHAPDLMTELKNILVTNPVLSNLILANTNLGTDDVITLAESLPIAKGLQALDVSYNPIGAAGVLSLAAAIKSNNSITSIDVFPILDTSWDNDESVLDSDLAAAVGIMEAVLSRNASNRPNKTEMVVRSLPSSFDPAQPASTPSLATASPGNFDPDELLTIAAMNTFSGSADDDMQEQDDNVRDLGKLRDSLTVAAKQQLYRRSQLHAAATNAPALSSTTREGSSTSSRASVGNGPQAVVLPPRKTSLQLSDSLQVLERRVAAAEETSTVFSDMLEMAQKQLTAELKPSLSQNELLKQLYDEAVHFQQKLQESLNNLDIYHEELMGKALAANDRLTQTRSQYDTLVGMRSASSLQDSVPTRPPLSRSQSQASMERLQKAQQQQASLSDMPAQLDVAKPSGAPAGGRRASKLLTIPEVSRTQPLEVMLLGSMSRGGSDEAITLGRLAGEDTQDVEDDPDHGSARPGNSTRGSSTLLLESSMAGSSLNSSSFNAMRRRLSTLENMFAGAASPMIADSVSSTVSTPASSSATQPPSLSSSLSSSALPSGRVGGHQRTLSAPHTHDQQQQQQQQQQKSRAANNRYSMGIRFTGEYASNGEFKSDFFESVEAALEKSAYDFKELLNRTDSSHEASIEQTALGSSAASSEPFMLLSLADLGLAGPTFQQSGDVPPVTAWKSIDLLNEGGSAAGPVSVPGVSGNSGLDKQAAISQQGSLEDASAFQMRDLDDLVNVQRKGRLS